MLITFSSDRQVWASAVRSHHRVVLRWVLALLFGLASQNGIAPAQSVTPRHTKGRSTGLPLPRFASLRSDPVNLRVGPGRRYPIKWVLHRRGMPVEIVQEFSHWRAVRLFDGSHGWVHAALLSGHRTFIVGSAACSLRQHPARRAAPVARLEAGVIGNILTCGKGSSWCKVSAGGYRGYVGRNEFWGTFKGEAVAGG